MSFAKTCSWFEWKQSVSDGKNCPAVRARKPWNLRKCVIMCDSYTECLKANTNWNNLVDSWKHLYWTWWSDLGLQIWQQIREHAGSWYEVFRLVLLGTAIWALCMPWLKCTEHNQQTHTHKHTNTNTRKHTHTQKLKAGQRLAVNMLWNISTAVYAQKPPWILKTAFIDHLCFIMFGSRCNVFRLVVLRQCVILFPHTHHACR